LISSRLPELRKIVLKFDKIPNSSLKKIVRECTNLTDLDIQGRRREEGGGRMEKGGGRREKGEGRREKGEGRREKGEGRREKGEEGGRRREGERNVPTLPTWIRDEWKGADEGNEEEKEGWRTSAH
jgi:hypothetical protein